MLLETNSMILANTIRHLEALHLIWLKRQSLIRDLLKPKEIKLLKNPSSRIMILRSLKDLIHLDLLSTDPVVSSTEKHQSLSLISMVLVILRIPTKERKISQEKSMRGWIAKFCIKTNHLALKFVSTEPSSLTLWHSEQPNLSLRSSLIPDSCPSTEYGNVAIWLIQDLTRL